MTRFLLHQYKKMSGDKKVRIGMQLSKIVRKVRKTGAIATKTLYGVGSSRTP